MNKAKRLLTDTLVFGLGDVVSKLLQFLLLPLYTLTLTTEEYGSAELLYNSIELVVPIFSLGVISAVFRYALEEDGDKKSVFSSGFSVLAVSYLLVAVAAVVWQHALGYPYAYLYALLYFSYTIRQFLAEFARGLGRSRVFAASGAINSLGLLVCAVLLLYVFRLGIAGYLLSLSIGCVLSACYIALAIRAPRFFFPGSIQRATLRELLRFGLPLVPALVSWWVMNLSGRYIVAGAFGVGMAGLYTAANKPSSTINIVTRVFQKAWQISATREIDAADRGGFYLAVFNVYSAAITVLCGGLVLFTPLICRFLLQGEYYNAWEYMPFALVAAAINCYSIFFEVFYVAAKRNKLAMVTAIAGAVTNIGLSLALISFMGIYGVLAAAIASYFLIVVLRCLSTRQYFGFAFPWLRFVVLTVLMVLQAVFVRSGRPELTAAAAVVLAGFIACGIQTNRAVLKRGLGWLKQRLAR